MESQECEKGCLASGGGEAIKAEPDDCALAYNQRGTAYHDSGDYDKAVADFNKAIELDPDAPNVYQPYAWRGLVYKKLGEKKKAIAQTILR